MISREITIIVYPIIVHKSTFFAWPFRAGSPPDVINKIAEYPIISTTTPPPNIRRICKILSSSSVKVLNTEDCGNTATVKNKGGLKLNFIDI